MRTHHPPLKKWVSGGQGGGGGRILGAFFAHFWPHFLTVGLTKKFIQAGAEQCQAQASSELANN